MSKSPPDLLARRLEQALLLNGVRQHDRLALPDARLLAALDGSQALTQSEAALLQASPLTLRRLRYLSMQQRANAAQPPLNWQGSQGQLLAAASHTSELDLQSTDRYWQLHCFIENQTWQIVLRLNLSALPAQTARALLQTALQVCDGAGGIILRGQLDGDAELQGVWPFADPPITHFLQHGAHFSVEPEGR